MRHVAAGLAGTPVMPPDGIGRLLMGLVCVLAAYGSLFGGAELLRRRGVRGEATRSLVHIGSGLLALALPCLFCSAWPILLLSITFAGAMLASRRTGCLGAIHDVRRPTFGAPLYPIGIAAAYVLTNGQAPGYAIAVLSLALGDPAASCAGRRFARRHASIWGTRRSLEGSASACLVSAAVTAAALLASGDGTAPLLAASIGVGLAVALAEATSPHGFDNLAIPVTAATVLDVAGTPWRLVAALVGLSAVTLLGLIRPGSIAVAAGGRGFMR